MCPYRRVRDTGFIMHYVTLSLEVLMLQYLKAVLHIVFIVVWEVWRIGSTGPLLGLLLTAAPSKRHLYSWAYLRI